MENSKISWCHHTMNPWRGCTRISNGCRFCYAETMSARNPGVLGVWGPQGTRVVAAEAQWRQPLKWDRMARDGVCYHCQGKSTKPDTDGRCRVCEGAGNIGPYRARVFCASLADVFEGRESMPEASWLPVEKARMRLFTLIGDTPHLDWQLLTKRPENILPMLDVVFGTPFVIHDSAAGPRQERWTTWKELGIGLDKMLPNVWLGTSIEDQETADYRVPHLLRCPAAVRFLSYEPALGPVDLTAMRLSLGGDSFVTANVLHHKDSLNKGRVSPAIDWVVCGGESGAHARPCDLEWLRSMVRQCDEVGVPCFVKQLGAVPSVRVDLSCQPDDTLQLIDRKGGDIREFPQDLRIRQFPTVTTLISSKT